MNWNPKEWSIFNKSKSKKKNNHKKGKNKKRVTVTDSDRYVVIGGVLGDKDERTKSNSRNLIFTLGIIILTIVSIVYLFISIGDYKEYKKFNTTKVGTELVFSQSNAKVAIGSVWTDKNRDVTVVQLKYDKASRSQLSTKGKNYNLYLVSDSPDEPDVEMKYGVLGTQGNGYLFIKGDLGERAYQVFIASQLQLSTGDDAEDDEDDISVTQDAEKLTDSAIQRALSESTSSDIDDNGMWNFASDNSEEPQADNIDFRLNPYSENTKVYNGSFLTDDGEIDYAKIIDRTSVKDILEKINDEIEEREENAKRYEVSLKEFEERLKDNEEDYDAQSDVDSTKDSIKRNNEKLEELRKLKERYEESDFTKESFGEMQEKHRFDVSK